MCQTHKWLFRGSLFFSIAFYKSHIHMHNHHYLHLIYFHTLLPPSLDQLLCSFFPSSLIFFTFSPYTYFLSLPILLPKSLLSSSIHSLCCFLHGQLFSTFIRNKTHVPKQCKLQVCPFTCTIFIAAYSSVMVEADQ